MSKMNLTPKNKRLLQEFKQFIHVRNYKGGSKKYAPAVLEFLSWAEQKGVSNIKHIQNSTLVTYYDYLINRPNKKFGGTLSDSSINHHLFALQLFFENLLAQQVIKKSILIPRRRNETTQARNILTVAQIKQLYTACETQLETALLSVAYGCGLRRSELHALNLSDISLTQGILVVKHGKGNKRREVPMSNQVINDLKTYVLEERPQYLIQKTTRIDALFISQQGNRITGGYLNDLLHKIIDRTNDTEIQNKKISLHNLRHSIATHLCDAGASMDFVRQFLGHSELDTAQIYAKRRKQKNIFLP